MQHTTQTSVQTDNLLPVVIPTEIVSHSLWPGPFSRWSDILSVTWAHFSEPHTTKYLTKTEARELEASRIPFAQLALTNLWRRSGEQVWTHIKEEAGETYFVALMHEDGLGPSRLLLRDGLHRAFPEGFSFCVPERTCAIVFSKQASPAALDSVRAVVSGFFRNGREPVSDGVFDEKDIVA